MSVLEDLLNLTRSEWFEEGECFLEVVEVALDAGVLTLSVNVNLLDSEEHQFWKIECVGPLEHKIALTQFAQLDLHADHVLLWSFLHPTASLSFVGEAEDPLAAVGALYLSHVKAVGTWFPFDRFLNGDPHAMISGRYGMLAQGPLPLIEVYAEVLDKFGINNGISEPRPAPYTNDSVVKGTEVELLILDNGSYVIASKFQAERLA